MNALQERSMWKYEITGMCLDGFLLLERWWNSTRGMSVYSQNMRSACGDEWCLLPPPRRLCVRCGLFVFLSICEFATWLQKWNLLKVSGHVCNENRNNWLDFGGDPKTAITGKKKKKKKLFVNNYYTDNAVSVYPAAKSMLSWSMNLKRLELAAELPWGRTLVSKCISG